jgi:hypothetical protein
MLPDATLLPELDATLYRAAAKIPGVRPLRHRPEFQGLLGSADEALLAVGVADKAGETPAT